MKKVFQFTNCMLGKMKVWSGKSLRFFIHSFHIPLILHSCGTKVKVIPRQAEVAQGVPGTLKPRIFLTFRHYKGGRSSAKRTGRLYPRRNPWYPTFRGWVDRRAHGSVGGTTEKNPQWHHRDRPTSSAAPWPLRYPRPIQMWN